MELKLTDLIKGISWWVRKNKWPLDFHNEVYHELYDLRQNGLSDDWWNKTVDRLWDWRAIRPLPKAKIKQSGYKVLPLLQRVYFDLLKETGGEPHFLDFQWQQIREFYNLLASIKASSSPVFPSKLGHFIFPKLFIVMDNEATGTRGYKDFWQSMHEAWNRFDEKSEAKQILLEEIEKHSTTKVHEHYPFEIKIIELCAIGKGVQSTYSYKMHLDPIVSSIEEPVKQQKGVDMKRLTEEFSCEYCRFSIERLKEMAEKSGKKEMFTTFGGQKWMNIYEVSVPGNFIVMRRSTGKFTHELNLTALLHVHDLVHSGGIDLDPHEIDDLRINGRKETWKWGNYIAALLRHLGCRKVTFT